MEYGLYDEAGAGGLKRARQAYSPSGVLTTSVQPDASVLPNARARLRQLQEQMAALEASEPDMTALQAFARQQGQAGESAMLNALAAQFAGESFAPVQAQFLKRSSAAREPIKMGNGIVTPDGQFVRDPLAARERQMSRLDRLIGAEKDDISAAERAEIARQDRLQREAEARQRDQRDFQNRVDQQNFMRQMQVSGQQRAPAGYQWTTGPEGQPTLAFIPGGPADPVNKTPGTPTEDERKAAGWYFQADNAVRNMAEVLRRTPGASDARVSERIVSFVPGVGQDLANMLRPEERQKFMQAADSMSEALLRASTGAAITLAEQNQKLRELIPQVGDTPGLIKQKLDSYKVYMDSLRARAGRAMPGGAAPAPGAPANANDPLGLRGR